MIILSVGRMRRCILLLWLLGGAFWGCASLPKTVSDCEKKAHSSLTAKQRQELCESWAGDYSIGPAMCSSPAKDKLRLSADLIVQLCKEASSDAPADCMLALDNAQRSSVGMKLCHKIGSAITADCFKWMSVAMKGSGKSDEVLQFCRAIDDRGPINCLQAVSNYTNLPINKALPVCKDAVGSGDSSQQHPLNFIVSTCVHQMSKQINPSLGVTAEDVVSFCVAINHLEHHHVVSDEDLEVFATAAIDCFQALSNATAASANYKGPALTVKHRMEICRNTHITLGPVNCTLQVLQKLSVKDPNLKLKGDQLAQLCSRASSAGPSDCFVESKGLGTVDERTTLCNSATTAGPAMCYRRSKSIFKFDQENRILLCVNAVSEGPAACAAAAPQYLAQDEKVHLCADAPIGAYNDPITCLNVVHSNSRNFQKAPKKALGYFQENLVEDSDWTSRGLLISMCSFSDSQSPLAAAECYKSVPTALDHDDAVRMCTNISSTEVIQHLQLCSRILPHNWPSNAVSTLCHEGLRDRVHTEAVVKCAIETVKLTSIDLSLVDIARVCRTESLGTDVATPLSAAAAAKVGTPVLSCIKKLHSSLFSQNSKSRGLNVNQTIYSLCAEASSASPAECLVTLLQGSASSMSFDPSVPPKLCKRSDYQSVLTCLSKQNKRFVSYNDLLHCLEEKRVMTTVRVKRILTEDNDIVITAGRRFAVWFEVYDQFDQLYDGPQNELLIRATLNELNPQGAVLWGLRSNRTANGMLQLNSLVISQPGEVEFRLLLPAQQSGDTKARTATPPLASFRLQVQKDPRLEETAPCMFVFLQPQCDYRPPSRKAAKYRVGVSQQDKDALQRYHTQLEADWNSYFPMMRSYISADTYLLNVHCAGETGLSTWHVQTHLSVDGSMHLEYRVGIDSIWTNVNLPRAEMTHFQRLQLSSVAFEDFEKQSRGQKKALVKTIKRAYYKQSLQWHPDRWAGYDQYIYAVQGAFQLIIDAYESLMERYGNTNSAAEAEASIITEDPVFA